ncbi:MAG: hypothetical protein WD069_07825 [Planctomycetales bacterium]
MHFHRPTRGRSPNSVSRARLSRAWRRFRDDERATGSGRAVFAATCVGVAIVLLGIIA